MPDRPLRIVLAEDSYLVREGTRHLLAETGEIEVLAAVGTAVELLDAVRRLGPDAVLTDIRMPPGNATDGIAAAHAIRRGHPAIGVVVLSQYAAPAYAAQLFAEGSAGYGYLLKDRVGDPDEVIAALRAVVAGRCVVDPQVVEGILSRTRAPRSPLSRLTPRELEVLGQMAQGRANPGIAKALALSESAVEKHVGTIFHKLGLVAEPELHRRVAAVLVFLRDAGTQRPPRTP
ncbi:response regulator transcription factor [Pseudonocardia nigra]|uniref:response regulator transcription factor n=1 Tax=Pseudonocardia nigra TaxID=1921578 RepID=UPI001FEA624B|nr:response regulator transcription factor [Pseudonocardia nigra]